MALVPVLAERPVISLIASPTMRCVQTLQPLSQHFGLAIVRSERVGPDGSLFDLLTADPRSLNGTVVCTHGELMEPLLEELRRRQTPILTERDDPDWLLSKGSAWHLTFDDRQFTGLRHEAPMPLPDCAVHASSE